MYTFGLIIMQTFVHISFFSHLITNQPETTVRNEKRLHTKGIPHLYGLRNDDNVSEPEVKLNLNEFDLDHTSFKLEDLK